MTGPQLLEGASGKEGVTLIRRGLQFSHKNESKSEVFNDKKKFISKNVFHCHNREFKIGNFTSEFGYF